MASRESIPFLSEPAPTPGAVEEARNPFGEDVCGSLLEIGAGDSVEEMHAEALDRLLAALERSEGGVLVLLTAPRAGHGKTHLLGRLAAALRGAALVLPVSFRTGDALALGTVCRRGLEALWQTEGERDGWSRLREVSAEVLAALTRQLIDDGQLACANRDQALRVLGGPAAEIFDERGSARLIGGWLKQNRDSLRQPLTALATERVSPGRTVDPLWLEALVDQAAEGGMAGLAAMQDLCEGNEPVTWLRLMGLKRPVVVLADHLDGLHRDTEAGVQVAAVLNELAETHGIRVVLSVNQDLWQGTFGSHLPSALEDRLTAMQASLRGLTAGEAEAVVRLRLERAGVTADEALQFEGFLATERYFLGRPLGSVALRTFLRHAARQWEMFKNSMPPPEETGEAAGWAPGPVPAEEPHPIIPLLPDAEPEGETPKETGEQMPAIFDADTTAYAKGMALGLADPRAERSAEPAAEPARPGEAKPDNEGGGVAPSPDAFEKLREMLGRLRQPSSGAAETPEMQEAAAESREAVGVAVAEEPPETVPATSEVEVLQGRYEALRLQMSAEADSQPLDFTKVGELVRLAGRRFPLVRLSEQELLGMAGRQVMCWSVQGMEIVFGLANFSDSPYWRAVSAFVEEKAAAGGGKVKLLTFKTDREQAAYLAMMGTGVLAPAVKERVDAVHLDAGSVASLYAMQRIVKEAETGALEVEPAQVMSAMARELDFFWRRLTRLG